MVVPAAIYLAFNAGGPGQHGWGIPMATDIAFAVGVLVLLGRHVPAQLAAFLLAVAVVDDIGAILVIALFYSDGLSVGLLLASVACLAAYRLMFAWRVRLVVPYAVLGVLAWAAMSGSGVSPTIAGVALGLLVPARPWRDPAAAHARARAVADDLPLTAGHGEQLRMWRRMDDLGRQAVPMTERILEVLHPWSAFVVLPLFALAWAGVPVSRDALAQAWDSPVTAGVAVGLVAGKALGVTLGTWLAVRLGLGDLPRGLGWAHVTGVACLAGIGFTVSVFVSSLAFDDAALVDQARIGILVASVVAGVLGSAILLAVSRRARAAS
jgi:NhaA family Na+:H+ antiporter